jgi:UPF0716 protein FxsA
MLARLILLFTIIPLIELAILIELGRWVGLSNTIAIVIITGVIGAALARSQGFGLINRIQNELSQGRIPTDSLIDGLLILSGAMLLLTPGLITDLIGLAFMLPFTRSFLKAYLKQYFMRKINTGEIHINFHADQADR